NTERAGGVISPVAGTRHYLRQRHGQARAGQWQACTRPGDKLRRVGSHLEGCTGKAYHGPGPWRGFSGQCRETRSCDARSLSHCLRSPTFRSRREVSIGALTMNPLAALFIAATVSAADRPAPLARGWYAPHELLPALARRDVLRWAMPETLAGRAWVGG